MSGWGVGGTRDGLKFYSIQILTAQMLTTSFNYAKKFIFGVSPLLKQNIAPFQKEQKVTNKAVSWHCSWG